MSFYILSDSCDFCPGSLHIIILGTLNPITHKDKSYHNELVEANHHKDKSFHNEMNSWGLRFGHVTCN